MPLVIIGIDSGDHRSFFYFLAGVDIDFGQGTRQTEGQYTEIPGCYGSGILMVESASGFDFYHPYRPGQIGKSSFLFSLTRQTKRKYRYENQVTKFHRKNRKCFFIFTMKVTSLVARKEIYLLFFSI